MSEIVAESPKVLVKVRALDGMSVMVVRSVEVRVRINARVMDSVKLGLSVMPLT